MTHDDLDLNSSGMPGRPEGERPAGRLESAGLDPETADSLQGCFLILSLLFRYPEAEVYQRLSEYLQDFDPLFHAYAGRSPRLIPQEELQAEYVRLFVNNRGFVPVIPYLSCYRDSDRLLAGNSLKRIRTQMKKTGFVLDEELGELEDHLAVLLEFCARIFSEPSRGEPPAEDEGGSLQALLQPCAGYLLEAAPTMSGLIREHAQYDIYRVAGETLENFLLDLGLQ